MDRPSMKCVIQGQVQGHLFCTVLAPGCWLQSIMQMRDKLPAHLCMIRVGNGASCTCSLHYTSMKFEGISNGS